MAGLGNGTGSLDIETRPISPSTSQSTPLPTPSPAEGRQRASACTPTHGPRGHLWLDSVPAMLEAAEQGLGVTLAMAAADPRPAFGRKLVAPFDFMPARGETIYPVSRSEQVRDRRIAAVRRWIVEAVKSAVSARAHSLIRIVRFEG